MKARSPMPKKCLKCSRFVTTDRDYCLRHSGVTPEVIIKTKSTSILKLRILDESEKPDSL